MIAMKRWGNTVAGAWPTFDTKGRFTPCAPVEWIHEVAESDCAKASLEDFQTHLGAFLKDSEMNEAEFRLFSDVLAEPASAVSGAPLPEYPG